MSRRLKTRAGTGSPNSRAVAYVRVSSEDQEEYSPAAQEAAVRGYADRLRLHLERVFSETGSAFRDKRAGFASLLAMLRAPSPPAHVLFHCVDRSTRNVRAYLALDDLVRAGTLTIHFVRESIVVHRDAPPAVFALWHQLVGFARYYSENLSLDVRKGMTTKAKRGLWPNAAPVGYVNVTRPDGVRVIVPSPDAPAVRKVFRACAGGMALSDLAALAARLGLRGRRTGRPLPRATVAWMLRNPLYCGRVEYAGLEAVGAHEAIIPVELWQSAQDALAGRRTGGRRRRGLEREWLFSGLVRCACGRAMTCAQVKGHRYLWCTRRPPCHRLREDVVRAAVDATMAALVPVQRFADEVRAGLARAAGEERTARLARLTVLRKRADELAAFGDRAYEDTLRGRITEDQHARLAAGWTAEAGQVRAEIADLEASAAAWHASGLKVLELACDLPGMWRKAQSVQEFRAILLPVVERITVEAGTVTIELAQPLAHLSLIGQQADRIQVGRDDWMMLEPSPALLALAVAAEKKRGAARAAPQVHPSPAV